MARTALLHHLLRSQTRNFSSRTFQSGYNPCKLGQLTHPPSVRHQLTASLFQLYAPQKRWSSRGASAEENGRLSIGPQRGREDEDDENDTRFAYLGPISSTIKKVKLLSLSTCCLSVSLGPVITFMTSTDSNVILKGAVASSVIFFSASTTGVLHWFVSPYIHKIKWQPGSDTFEVVMMTWLATFTSKTLKFADIRVADTNRPFVTFKANDTFYFVDADHCHNKALLAKLTPRKSTYESAFKNL